MTFWLLCGFFIMMRSMYDQIIFYINRCELNILKAYLVFWVVWYNWVSNDLTFNSTLSCISPLRWDYGWYKRSRKGENASKTFYELRGKIILQLTQSMQLRSLFSKAFEDLWPYLRLLFNMSEATHKKPIEALIFWLMGERKKSRIQYWRDNLHIISLHII